MPQRKYFVSRWSSIWSPRYNSRYHEIAQPYPFLTRFFDYRAGCRDPRVVDLKTHANVAAESMAADGSTVLPTTRWLSRNIKTTEEAMQHEFLDAEARTAYHAHELDSTHRSIVRLRAEIAELREERTTLLGTPKPELAGIVRGAGVKNVPDAVLLGREQQKWNAPIAALAATVTAKRAELEQLEAHAASLSAEVLKVFDLARTRALGNRSYGERRSSVYLRGLTRRHPQGAHLQAILGGTDTIPMPAWISLPCPWVPVDYLPKATPITHPINEKSAAPHAPIH